MAVDRREELEAALAQTEAAREVLEVAFAEAKAALLNTVTDASKIDANQAEASAKVDKARARCRELRAALVKLDHSTIITRSRERKDTVSKQSEELSTQKVTAPLLSVQSRDQALRGENRRSQDESRKGKLVDRFKINFLGQEPYPRDALERIALIRRTIELLGLVLAYLLYFHADVQLQIVSLPSVFG